MPPLHKPSPLATGVSFAEKVCIEAKLKFQKGFIEAPGFYIQAGLARKPATSDEAIESQSDSTSTDTTTL